MFDKCVFSDVLTAKYIPSSDSMVLVLEGSSEHDAPIWSDFGHLIPSMHLFTSTDEILSLFLSNLKKNTKTQKC